MYKLKYLFICLFFLGCQKDKTTTCRIESFTTFDPFPTLHIKTSLEYDDQDRFIEITRQFDKTTLFRYYEDSIVLTEKTGSGGNDRITVYFLNDRGMADSSKTRYAMPTSFHIAYDQKFTYNSEDYLLSHFVKNEYLSNGTVFSDTGTSYFNYEQGNLMQVTYNNLPYKRYAYTNIETSSNITQLIHPYPYLPFLGQPSKHLVSIDINATGGPVHYSYEFDAHGKLIKMNSPVMGVVVPRSTSFVYNCN